MATSNPKGQGSGGVYESDQYGNLVKVGEGSGKSIGEGTGVSTTGKRSVSYGGGRSSTPLMNKQQLEAERQRQADYATQQKVYVKEQQVAAAQLEEELQQEQQQQQQAQKELLAKQLFSEKAQQRYNIQSTSNVPLSGVTPSGEQFAIGKSGVTVSTKSSTAQLMPESFGGYTQPKQKKQPETENAVITEFKPQSVKEALEFKKETKGLTEQTLRDIGLGVTQSVENIVTPMKEFSKSFYQQAAQTKDIAGKLPEYKTKVTQPEFMQASKQFALNELSNIDLNNIPGPVFSATTGVLTNPSVIVTDIITKPAKRQEVKEAAISTKSTIESGVELFGAGLGRAFKQNPLKSTVSVVSELAAGLGIEKAIEKFGVTKLVTKTETFIPKSETVGRARVANEVTEVTEGIQNTKLKKIVQKRFLKEVQTKGITTENPATIERVSGIVKGLGKAEGKIVSVGEVSKGTIYFPEKDIVAVIEETPTKSTVKYYKQESGKLISQSSGKPDIPIGTKIEVSSPVRLKQPEQRFMGIEPIDQKLIDLNTGTKEKSVGKVLASLKQQESVFQDLTKTSETRLTKSTEYLSMQENIKIGVEAKTTPTIIKKGQGVKFFKKEGESTTRVNIQPPVTKQTAGIEFVKKSDAELIPVTTKYRGVFLDYEKTIPKELSVVKTIERKVTGERILFKGPKPFNEIVSETNENVEDALGKIISPVKNLLSKAEFKISNFGKKGESALLTPLVEKIGVLDEVVQETPIPKLATSETLLSLQVNKGDIPIIISPSATRTIQAPMIQTVSSVRQSTEQTVIPKQIITTNIALSQKNVLSQAPITKTTEQIKTKSVLEQIPASKSMLDQTTNTRSRTEQVPVTVTATEQIQEVVNKPVTEQVTKPLFNNVTYPITEISMFRLPKLKPVTFSAPPINNEKDKSPRQLFTAEVRRQGRFIEVGQFESPYAAFAKARTVVSETAAASLRVRSSSSGSFLNQGFGLSPTQFTKSTKEKGVFIERPEKRIKSRGEKEEITFRGIAMQRIKKSRNKGVFRL